MIYALVAVAVWSLALNHASSGAHFFKHGLDWLLTGRDEVDRPEATVLEGRLARAQRNHLENLMVFMPMALLALHLGHGQSTWAVVAAWGFLGARIGHVIFYAAGMAPLRSASHTCNLLAHGVMLLVVLGWIPG